MKNAVDDQLGPFMMSVAISPIQLSPAVIEVRLCWLSFSLTFPGMMIEKLGSVPLAASVLNCAKLAAFFTSAVSQQSARDGQIAQPSPAGCLPPPS
jgi:hypothetical protein